MNFLKKILTNNFVQLKVLMALCLFVFISHFVVVKTVLYSDIRFYYATARSIVLDHNLNQNNEYFDLGMTTTALSNVKNPYPIGIAIFITPSLFITNSFINTLNFFGFRLVNTGYETIYQLTSSLGNIFLSLIAYLVLKKSLEKYYSKNISFFTSLTIFLGTNIFFYSTIEPLMSHSLSFLISTLFVYVFFTEKKDGGYYKKLGLLAGIAGLIRTQDMMLITLPVIQIFIDRHKKTPSLSTYLPRGNALSTQTRSIWEKASFLRGFLLLTSFLIAFSPQIIYWRYFFNTFWYSPFLDVGFNFTNPKILHILFNLENGAFTITPVCLLGFLGFLFPIMQKFVKLEFKICKLFRISDLVFRISIYGIVYFILQLYLVSSWNDSQGGSFGIRMLISTLPFLAIGLGNLYTIIEKKYKTRSLIPITSSLIILNKFMIVRYLLQF